MKFPLARTLLAAAIATASVTAQAAPTLEEMWEVIQQQRAEIEALKSQLNKTDTKLEQTEVKIIATADAVEQTVVSGGAVSQMARWAEKTTLGGYGEHHFNHKEDKDDQIDAHRYVLYVGHQFNDNVRFFSEFELEHSLAGDGKPGEVELEQAYIEWDYTDNHSVQFGQFLVPVGLMNETHEPDAFYGTERNKVEAEVIPATWWEAGVAFNYKPAGGVSIDGAVTSGLSVGDDYKIRGGRQKVANASAENLAYTARVKYTAINGLELAATAQYQTDVTQGKDGVETAGATLLEAHAIYQVNNFSVRALYARWDIDGAEAADLGRDEQTGWYIEPSYAFNDKVGVFARYAEYDNNAGNSDATAVESTSVGVNYYLHENVVLKADYEDLGGAKDDKGFNLGFGYQF